MYETVQTISSQQRLEDHLDIKELGSFTCLLFEAFKAIFMQLKILLKKKQKVQSLLQWIPNKSIQIGNDLTDTVVNFDKNKFKLYTVENLKQLPLATI